VNHHLSLKASIKKNKYKTITRSVRRLVGWSVCLSGTYPRLRCHRYCEFALVWRLEKVKWARSRRFPLLTIIKVRRELDGCIVLNAHDTLFGSKPYRLATTHQGYRQKVSISSDISDQLFSHLLMMLLKLSFRRLLRVDWTGATRCSMVCGRTCWGRCSRCRTLPLVYLQHTAPWPHHSGAATTSLAAGPETSGVQDCMSCTPIARFNGADLPVCRHSSCLGAWSPSSQIFISTTDCTTDANHLRWQKLHCRRTAPVEQFDLRQISRYGQFRRHLKTHLFRA